MSHKRVEPAVTPKVGTKITLYAVYSGADEHYAGKPKWYFTDKDVADAVAEGRGWYGGDAHVAEVSAAYMADGRYWLLADIATSPPLAAYDIGICPDDEDEVRRSALAKLTKREQQVLGVSKPGK